MFKLSPTSKVTRKSINLKMDLHETSQQLASRLERSTNATAFVDGEAEASQQMAAQVAQQGEALQAAVPQMTAMATGMAQQSQPCIRPM